LISSDSWLIKHLGRFQLRTVLVIPFVLLIAITIGITEYLSYRNGQQAVNNVATRLNHEIANRVHLYLTNYLTTPHFINQLNFNAVQTKQLHFNLDTPDPNIDRYLWQQLTLFPNITWISIGSELTGDYYGITRQTENRSLSFVNVNDQTNRQTEFYEIAEQGERGQLINTLKIDYDARTRPWYTNAIAANDSVWSDIYLSPVDSIAYLTASRPIYDDQENLLGVIGVDFNLDKISRFLQDLEISPTGEAYIIDRDGFLIGSSITETAFIVRDDIPQQKKATESNSPILKATAAYLTSQFANLSTTITQQTIQFPYNGDIIFVQVVPIQDEFGLDWLIVVVTPSADFMEQIEKTTQLTSFFSLFALLLSIGVSILTAHWVIRPILTLNMAAKNLAKGEWEQPLPLHRQDEVGQLAHSFNDMTNRLRQSHQELEQTVSKLQELDRMKAEFLTNMSHEIRTPLNAILGFSDVLLQGLDGELPPQAHQDIQLIHTRGQHLLALVNDVLDISKIEAGLMEIVPKPLDIYELIPDIEKTAKTMATGKPVKLSITVAPNLPNIYADTIRVKQILVNLLDNAIKFTLIGDITIKVVLDVTPNQVKFMVIDTGVGILESQQSLIFERFKQIDMSKTKVHEGTGLGLAICKELVELHGGKIGVKSQAGEGSEFWFTIPTVDRDIDQDE